MQRHKRFLADEERAAMAARMGELDTRAQERLRSALGETLAARFAYPGFYGYGVERLRVRPLDHIKRQEIAAYVETVGFAPLEPMAVDSAELRRYFEGVFLRYLDVNPHLGKPRMTGKRAQLRVEAQRAAEELQRELVAFVEGSSATFAAAPSRVSWSERASRAAQPQWASSPPESSTAQVPSPAPPSRPPIAPASRVGPQPPPPVAPSSGEAPPIDDRQVFAQLRLQLESYIRLAVRSYGLPERGGDPARALDDLRSSGLVDDTNLSLAERILALTDGVRERGSASIDDYRQALTLYLLYHRSHLKS